MEINPMTSEECSAFLERTSLGRLGCSYEDQAYVVPIHFAYDSGYLYVFSTFGQKVRWMRRNPKVCVQTDQIENQGEWLSVIVNGQYEGLPEPQYTAERKHARSLLARHSHWWLMRWVRGNCEWVTSQLNRSSFAFASSRCRGCVRRMKRRGVDNC